MILGIIIIVVLFMLFVAAMGTGLFAYTERTQAKAEANAPEILEAAFDGRPDVVFKVNAESPKYETVILGAKEHGYQLTHETDNAPGGRAKTLIFERM